MVLVLAALCFSALGKVDADTYGVTASVPYGTLTQPATITSPTNGSTVNASLVTVQGTCQVVISGTIVILERDGAVIGSQSCQANGTFAIPVTLLEGDNDITPKVSTTTNDPGPDGAMVRIRYERVVVPPPSTPPALSPTPAGVPAATPAKRSSTTAQHTPTVMMQTNTPFLVFYRNQPVSLLLNVQGGKGPYNLTIAWGDGATKTWSIETTGARNYSHIYENADSYTITATVTDAEGVSYVLQISTAHFMTPGLTVTTPANPFTGALMPFTSTLGRVVWGVYASVCMATVLLWWLSPTHTLLWNGHAPGHPARRRK